MADFPTDPLVFLIENNYFLKKSRSAGLKKEIISLFMKKEGNSQYCVYF